MKKSNGLELIFKRLVPMDDNENGNEVMEFAGYTITDFNDITSKEYKSTELILNINGKELILFVSDGYMRLMNYENDMNISINDLKSKEYNSLVVDVK